MSYDNAMQFSSLGYSFQIAWLSIVSVKVQKWQIYLLVYIEVFFMLYQHVLFEKVNC